MQTRNRTTKQRKDKGAPERGYRERLEAAAEAKRALLERLRAARHAGGTTAGKPKG